MATASVAPAGKARGLDYRLVWRWHFYAGLFCIPFVLWLSCTGTIFLFKPQIERFLDRPYDHLTITQRASADDQVQAALKAIPGSILDSYELPHTSTSAAQILVDKGSQQFRVYVHPQTLAVLHVVNEDMRLENVVFRLHGELLMGNAGSYIVETAASWAVVMILSGLYLWWPRTAKGLAGVLYPRLRSGKKFFWRDIHAVTGIYVSFFALFLLLTGLPWAKGWGAYLKTWRHFAAGHAVHQDWTTSSAEIVAARRDRTDAAASSAVAAANNETQQDTSGMSTMHDMDGMTGIHHMEGMAGMSTSGDHTWHKHGTRNGPVGPNAYKALDTMIATVAPLNLAQPVLISPPIQPGGSWTARSDTRDRPLRVDLTLDSVWFPNACASAHRNCEGGRYGLEQPR